MRTFAAISAGGLISIVLIKVLVAVLIPLVGVLIGLFLTGLKILFMVAVGYFVYSLIFKRRKESETA